MLSAMLAIRCLDTPHVDLGGKLPKLQRLLEELAVTIPNVDFEAFDGSSVTQSKSRATVTLCSPLALARIVRAPRGLGLARAYIAGDITVSGDLTSIVALEKRLVTSATIRKLLRKLLPALLSMSAQDLRRAGPLPEEYKGLLSARHSPASDEDEIRFHYDLDPAFYACLLGESMTYSCALFLAPDMSLDEAQDAKLERILDLLHVDEMSTLLDVGCGWGSLMQHARARAGRVIGLTASKAQYVYCQQSMMGDEFSDVRLGDYRKVLPLVERATVAASVGIYEHVGIRNSETFFGLIRQSLVPGGRYLDQSIYRPESRKGSFRRNSFVERYVFPNAQLQTLSTRLEHLNKQGFRVLMVESFGEHYAETLKQWISNLETHWEECVRLEGERRARAWLLYLHGSRQRFEDGDIDVARVLTEAK